MSGNWRILSLAIVMGAAVSVTGCSLNRWSTYGYSDDCEPVCRPGGRCGSGGGGCRPGFCQRSCFGLTGWCCRRSNAIPETLPLGSTVRAHYQAMETNGEAADFIVYLYDFMGETAQLTPDGKDHVLEIAARMRSAPFPVLIERSYNNSDPELDAHRRNLVAQILTDLGNPDAQQRTVVATTYGPGYNAVQAVPMYYQHLLGGSQGSNFGSYGNNFGTYGGFGGGAGGAIGFGP